MEVALPLRMADLEGLDLGDGATELTEPTEMVEPARDRGGVTRLAALPPLPLPTAESAAPM